MPSKKRLRDQRMKVNTETFCLDGKCCQLGSLLIEISALLGPSHKCAIFTINVSIGAWRAPQLNPVSFLNTPFLIGMCRV